MENSGDEVALEYSYNRVFTFGANNDADDGEFVLQTMPANGDHLSVLQHYGKLPQSVIGFPKVNVVRNDLWTNCLPRMKGDIRRQLGFVYILADQQTTSHRITVVHPRFTSEERLLCNHLFIAPELNPVEA